MAVTARAPENLLQLHYVVSNEVTMSQLVIASSWWMQIKEVRRKITVRSPIGSRGL